MIHRRPHPITPFHYSLIALAICSYAASAHAGNVAWTTDASDSWTTPSNWSSNPSLPGPADDVTINQPDSITVTLSSDIQSINSLTNDNTLTLSGGILNVATTLHVNGTLNINGGTLQNATLTTGPSGTLNFSSGTLSNVTLATNLTLTNTSLILVNGLTLANSTLSLSNTNGSATLNINGTQTIGGTGVIEFDGTTQTFVNEVIAAAAPLTIGPNVTVQTGTAGGFIDPSGFVNQGTISAQTPGQTLTINPTTWSNTGTLKATNGGTLVLGGTFTGLGNFNSTGGTIEIAGTLDNTGNILALNGVGNSLAFIVGGGIKNGTIAQPANGAVLTFNSGSFLSNVTLATNLTLTNTSLILVNGLTLANSTLSLSNTNGSATLNINGTQTIGGTGVIEFDGTTQTFVNEVIAAAAPLTIGPNVTVQTGTAGGFIDPSGFVNQGTISAQTPGQTLTINPTTWSNTGTLKATNGGTLVLGGTFTGLGNFNSTGGTIEIAGTLDNTGNILALNGVGNSLAFIVGGGIKNGTIAQPANGAVLTFNSGSFLSNVTLATNLTLTNTSLILVNGLTLANSTLSLSNTNGSATLNINGTQTIGGTGVIEFDGTTQTFVNEVIAAAAPLTIGPNVTVQTGTAGGFIDPSGFVNQGTISAQTPGQTLTINPTTWSNTGTLKATNGGTLVLGGTFTGLGNFNSTGGTIEIAGTLDNTGNILALNGVGNSLAFIVGGGIKNGTIAQPANGAVLTFNSGSFLSNVTLATNLTLTNTSLILVNGLTLANSTLSLSNTNGSATLNINGTQTIGGTGVIEFDGTTQTFVNEVIAAAAPLTIGPNVTVQTGTAGGFIDPSGFVNQGTISAQTPGQTLTINPTTWSNTGTLKATNGGTLVLGGTFTGLGNFNSTGGTIQIAGTLDNTNSTLTLNGVGNSLLLTGTIKNGNVSIAGGATTITSGTFNVASLTFGGSTNAWTGALDLTQNKAIVEPTSANKSTLLATLENQAVFGRTNSAGLISSTIPANQAIAVIDNAVINFTTFAGQPVDANSILIAPELLGDTNIDGHVDLTDLSTILNNFGSATGAWTSGNFDGQPTIDLTDLSDILNNFGAANPNASSSQLPITDDQLPTATPEPTSLLSLLPTFLLLQKRRKS